MLGGYSVTVCYTCSNYQFTGTQMITFKQIRDCYNTMTIVNPLPNLVIEFSNTPTTTLPFSKVATTSHPECQVSCSVSGTSQDKITTDANGFVLVSNFEDGYSHTLPVICTQEGVRDFAVGDVLFRQIQNCAPDVVSQDSLSYTLNYQLSLSFSTIAPLSSIFKTFQDSECLQSTCEVFQNDCSTAGPGDLQLAQNELQGKTDNENGYTYSICLKCENSAGIVEKKPIAVTQHPNCANQLSVTTELSDHLYPYSTDNSGTKVFPLSDYFTSTKSECPIIECEVKTPGCSDPFPTGGPQVNPSTGITMLTSRASGYTNVCCLICSQYGNSASLDNVKFTQIRDCGTDKTILDITMEDSYHASLERSHNFRSYDTHFDPNCKVSSCALFLEDCTTPSSTNTALHALVTMDETTISMKRSEADGYQYSVCAKCTNLQGIAQSIQVQVVQRQDCSETLSRDLQVHVFDYGEPASQTLQKAYFYSLSKASCTPACTLKASDCSSSLAPNSYYKGQTSEEITFDRYQQSGWTATYCLVCSQTDQTSNFDEISIRQKRDCTTVVSAKQAEAYNLERAYDSEETQLQLGTVDNWFDIINDADYPVTCQLLAYDCASAYSDPGYVRFADSTVLVDQTIEEGYQVFVCIKCTACHVVETAKIIFKQARNCETALYTTGSVSDQVHEYQPNKEILIASTDTLFASLDLASCPITACSLRNSDCQGLYTESTYVRVDAIGDDGVHKAYQMIKFNKEKGYKLSLCIKCETNGKGATATNVFVVQQTRNCATSITAKQQSNSFTKAYVATDETSVSSIAMATYFIILDPSVCGGCQASLLELGTTTNFVDDRVSLNTNDVSLEMKVNVEAGYTVRFAFQCKNELSGAIINIELIQIRDCSTALQVNEIPNLSTEFSSSQGETEHFEIYTYFDNLDRENCALTSCDVMEGEGCSSEYTGNKVMVKMEGGLYKFKQRIYNEATGWSLTVCIQCTNGDQTITSSPFTVTQNVDCTRSYSVISTLDDRTFTLQYSTDPSSQILGRVQDFVYSLDRTGECGEESVTLLQPGQTNGYSNSNVDQWIGEFKIGAKLDVPEGYSTSYDLKIGNSFNSEVVQFSFTQVRDCGTALSKTKEISGSAYDFGTSTPQAFLVLSDHVTVQSPDDCGISECNLFDNDCSTPSVSDKLTIESNFDLTINHLDIDNGYTEEFCYKCTNGLQTVNLGSFQIKQLRNCATQISLSDTSRTLSARFQAVYEIQNPIGEFFIIKNPYHCTTPTLSLADTALASYVPGTDILSFVTGNQNGYTTEITLQCTNGVQTVSATITFTQIMDCSIALGIQEATEDFDVEYSLDNPDPSNPYRTQTQLFRNLDPTNCGITSCSLRKLSSDVSQCSGILASSYVEIVKAGDEYVLNLLTRSVEAGYTETMCFSCTNGEQTISDGPFQIKQKRNCQTGVTVKKESDSLTISYDAEEVIDFITVADYFNIIDPDDCGGQQCLLIDPETQVEYFNGKLSLVSDNIKVLPNVEDGITYIFIYKCQNGVMSKETTLTLNQIRNCATALAVDAQPDLYTFEYANPSSTQTIFNSNLFFSNQDATNCAITACNLYQSEVACQTEYAGDELVLDDVVGGNAVLKIKKTHEENGYLLENLCFQCLNGLQTVSTNKFSVKQNRNCHTGLLANMETKVVTLSYLSEGTQPLPSRDFLFTIISQDDDCAPFSCQPLLDKSCSSPITSPYIELDDSQKLIAQRGVEDGYGIDFCYACTNKVKTATVAIQVQQIRNCATALSIASQPTKKTFEFESPNNAQVVYETSSIFANKDEDNCGLIECKLLYHSCQYVYDYGLITLEGPSDGNAIVRIAQTKTEKGYLRELCIECGNGLQTVTTSQFQIKQNRNCHTGLVTVETTKEFKLAFEAEGSQRLGDRNDFFTIIMGEDDDCAPLTCQGLLTLDCRSEFAQDNIWEIAEDSNALTVRTSVEDGYTLNFCYACTNKVKTATVTIQVQQVRNCETALSWSSPMADLKYTFEQVQTPFHALAINQYIENKDLANCPITSCQILLECTVLFEGEEMIIKQSSEQFYLSLMTLSFDAGFSQALCISCQNSLQTIVSNEFNVQQVRNCLTGITKTGNTDFVQVYDAEKQAMHLGTYNIFFTISDQTNCGFTECQLYDETCEGEAIEDPNVQYVHSGENKGLSMRVDVKEGYARSLCMSCLREGTSFSQKFTLYQKQDCSNSLSLPEDQVTTQNIQYNDVEPTTVVWKGLEVFPNSAKEGDCPMLQCSMMAVGCTEVYSGRLSMDGTTPPFSIASLRNVHFGFTETFCLKCQNPTQDITKELTVVQKRLCKQVISPNTEKSTSKTYQYTQQSQEIGNAIDYFVETTPEGCQQMACELLASDCSTQASGKVQMANAYPFKLTVLLDQKAGFEETVCLQCSNEDESIYFSELKIVQQAAAETEEEQEKFEQVINIAPFLEQTPQNFDYELPVGETDLVFEIPLSNPLKTASDIDSLIVDGGLLGQIEISFQNGQLVVKKHADKMNYDQNKEILIIEFENQEELEEFQGENTIRIKLSDDNGLSQDYHLVFTIKESEELIQHKIEEKQKEEEAKAQAAKEEEEKKQQELEQLKETLTQKEVEELEKELQQAEEEAQEEAEEQTVKEETLKELDEELEQLEKEAALLAEANNGAQLTKQQKVVLEEKKAKIIQKKEMVSSGFKISSAGFVFPGVDPKQIDQVSNQLTSDTIRKLPEPKATILPVTQFGEIKIKFNQDMIAPPVIQQFIYKHAFLAYIISSEDNTIWYGRFQTKSKKERSLQEEDPLEEERNLQFNLRVTEHQAQSLVLKMEFEEPGQVSRLANDQLVFKIKDPSLFKSSLSLKVLDQKYNQLEVLKDMPQIISDEQLGRLLQNSTESADNIFDLVTSSNFITNFLLKTSMQQLWGMIRALQIIVYQDLVRIPKPSHLQIFFEGCIAFASTDILDGNEIFYSRWNYRKSEPLNSNFDRFDFGTMIFTKNSGSYFLIQTFIFMYYPGRWMITKLALHFSKIRFCRKVGMTFEQKEIFKPIITSSQKLFLETYFDLCLAICIALVELTWDFSILWDFSYGTPDVIDSILFLVTLTAIFGFIAYGMRQIIKNFDDLKQGLVDWKDEIYLDGIRCKTKGQALYVCFFLIRRLAMAFILVFLRNYPIFQLMLLLQISLLNLQYIIHTFPLEHKLDNQLEIFDEYAISFIVTLNYILINTAQPAHVRSFISWVMILMSSINMIFHFILLFKDTFLKLRLKFYVWKRQSNLLKQKKKNSTESEEDPEAKQTCQQQFLYQEAIKYARNWYPERKWLLDNGVEIANLPEEVEFQRICHETPIFKEHKQQQKIKSIQKAIDTMVEYKIKENFSKRVSKLQKKFEIKKEAEDMEEIKEETEQVSSLNNDFKKLEKDAFQQIRRNNLFNEEFDASIFAFDDDKAGTNNKMHELDFMLEEEELDKEVEDILAPIVVVGKNYRFHHLAKFTKLTNGCHPALVWCLTEVNLLAEIYRLKPINNPNKPWATFMSKLYKQLYQEGSRNHWTTTDMSAMVEQSKKNGANYFNQMPIQIMYKIDRDILNKHQLERKKNASIQQELYAFDLRQVSECVNGCKINKRECYKYGFDIHHSGTIQYQINNRMRGLDRTIQCECGKQTAVKAFARKIQRYPPYLLARTERRDHSRSLQYQFEIDYMHEYKDEEVEVTHSTKYELFAQLTELTKEDGSREFRSIVKKRKVTGQNEFAWYKLDSSGNPVEVKQSRVKIRDFKQEQVFILFYQRADVNDLQFASATTQF